MNPMKMGIIILMLASGALGSLIAVERPFSVTLCVLDDGGRPVSGAEAGVTFENMKVASGPKHFVSPVGLSNENGRVELAGEMFLPRLAYGAEKEGYYQTTGLKYQFFEDSGRRWEPWDPTIEMVLKPIKNPVPMYAKNAELKIPEFDKPIGYDLVVGDWVAPYGAGEKSDFVFEARRSVRSDRDYEGSLTLDFSNAADGLITFNKPREDGSELRLPYLAPIDGYVAQRVWREKRQPAPDGRDKVQSDSSSTMNYFFRVRTVVDGEGKVVSAYYGKIHGDIRYFIGTKAPRSGLAFTYYLNPDGTRNVEFDPKRNLFQPAKPGDSAFWNLGP